MSEIGDNYIAVINSEIKAGLLKCDKLQTIVKDALGEDDYQTARRAGNEFRMEIAVIMQKNDEQMVEVLKRQRVDAFGGYMPTTLSGGSKNRDVTKSDDESEIISRILRGEIKSVRTAMES